MFENPSGPVSNPGIPAAWRASPGLPAGTPSLRWSYSATVPLVAAAYLLAAWVGLLLAIPPGYASPIWPPAGIALAALLVLGRAALPGIFIGAATANIGVMGTAPVVALAIGAGNAAEALVAGLLIHRFIGSRDWFETPGSVARFVAIAFAASMVAASNGVMTLALAGQVPWAEFGTHWTTWWLGDATGIVIVAPLLLCWREPAGERARSRHMAEYALFAALLLLCAAMIRLDNRAVQDAVQTVAYLMIPLVTWAATRLDRRAVAAASFAVSAIAVVDVLDGRAAPFVSLALNESLLLMQLFVSMVATTGLILSAFSGEIARASRRAAAGEQQACTDRLSALAHRMVQVRDDERRHLAAELHDGLAQHLTGLNVSLDVVRCRAADSRDPWLLERIDEAASLTKRASQCIRDVMVGLRPPDANSAPLSSILRRHAAAFETRTGILVSVNAPLAPLRVAPGVKDALSRICLEALNNVSKHADADSVRVTLQTNAECVELDVEDDGTGFETAHAVPDEDRSRLGIRIMEERALSIGGSFRIVSAPGAGTSVEVVVPRSQG